MRQQPKKKSNEKSRVSADERLALNVLHANLFSAFIEFQIKNPGQLKVEFGPVNETPLPANAPKMKKVQHK